MQHNVGIVNRGNQQGVRNVVVNCIGHDAPARWCHRQWRNMTSPIQPNCNGLWNVLIRITAFVPLIILTLFSYLIYLTSSICSSRCSCIIANDQNNEVIRGNGIIEERRVDLGQDIINSVTVCHFGNLTIRRDNHNSLTTATDSNLFDLFQSQVVGTMVSLDCRPGTSFTATSLNQTLTISSAIKYIKLAGSSQVALHTDAVDANELTCRLSGSGNIQVLSNGQTLSQRIRISGCGNYTAENLIASTSDIDISGAGNATIRTSRALTVRISGAGTCNYYGNPQRVDQNITGVGSVNSLG
jgi:hypothetical protein